MRKPLSYSKHDAFSLVELSIVLVILGLVVGAFIAGESLLTGQKLRTVTTDASKYMIAMNQFKQQYGFIAGDFPNATSIWGRADGGTPVSSNCTTPDTAASTGKATCNGDGNGYLSAPLTHETYRAWQHLFAAGLIDGKFTGVSDTAAGVGSSYIVLGSTVPTRPGESTGYHWQSGPNVVNSNLAADANYYDGDYSNALIYGKRNASNALGAGMGAPALRPQQMNEIDVKLDDGVPSTGNIRSWKNSCLNAGAYDLGTTTISCVPIFMSTFGIPK